MNREELQKIAGLARLEIKNEELDTLVLDFQKTLEFIDKIKDVEIPENSSRELESENIMRSDDVGPIEPEHDLIKVAPKNKDGFVEVPKVLE